MLTRIIFAPHEDDAVLSSGGLIQKSLKEGINVVIVYMTDGSACYLVSNIDVGMTLQEVAQMRKLEALRGCKVLGIPSENIHFLNIPDQHLSEPNYFNSALQAIKTLLSSYKELELFIPIGKNPHPDHNTTHKIVVQAVTDLNKSIPIYQYGLHKSVKGRVELKVKLTPEMLARKIEAYNCHQSQKFNKLNDIAASNNDERFKLLG
ncbi:MAG: PIG-L deacetylase family protein [Candidatus Helarchaeota archaeon]